MGQPRIYYPHSLKAPSVVALDKEASHHLLTVLKLKVGESLQLFNGEGGAYTAVLKGAQKKLAIVDIREWTPLEPESPLTIHLGQAISRGDRMDYTIQKSVELGINRITPLFTDRCSVRLNAKRVQNRVEHWQKVAFSASEQSGRCRIATVERPQTLTDFFSHAIGLKLICSLSAAPHASFPSDSVVPQITVLIGPEGGFTPSEIAQAQQAGFSPFSLGPRILRTETAATVALTLLQNRWGDLKA